MLRDEELPGLNNGAADEKSPRFIRDSLVQLVAHLFGQSPWQPTHHQNLVQNLIKNDALNDVVFVSTNYDIVIDNCLIGLRFDSAIDIDYGIDFFQPDWERPRAGKYITLLKPHGSLNWLNCRMCGQLKLTPGEKLASLLLLKEETCNRCNHPNELMIVPPTFFKNLSNFHLASVWRRLERELHDAERIIFCGYSFPDADVHLKYAVKRAEALRSEPWKIYLVNMYGTKKSRRTKIFEQEKQSELERYRRFFSSAVVMSCYSFEEFAEDPNLDKIKPWDASNQ